MVTHRHRIMRVAELPRHPGSPERPPVPDHMPPSPYSRRRPAYDPSRDRGRLRHLFWMGVVLIVVYEVARKPANWSWLTELDRPRPRAVEPKAPKPRLGGESLPDGVLRIEAASEAPAAAPPAMPTGDVPLAIPRDLVALIDHEYHVVRESELPAIARMLAAVRASSPSRLEQAARREATFTEIANDPERYAGGLYRFDAEVRRCQPISLTITEGHVETLYEAWAFTESGGRKNPYRILCTDIPPGFPIGETIRARVNVSAYFVKQYAYVTDHGPHVAPLFIARRFRWIRPPEKLSDEVGAAPVLTLVLAAAAVGLSMLAWRLNSTVGRGRSRKLGASLGTPSALAELATSETTSAPTDVEDFLRTLAATEPPPEPPDDSNPAAPSSPQ